MSVVDTARTGARTVTVPLLHAAHARAGDKGNRSNIAVIAWHPELYALIETQITDAAVARHFRSRHATQVARYLLPTLHAMNFVLDGVLDGGVTQALNLDSHGKALSFLLLDMPLEVPAHLTPLLRGDWESAGRGGRSVDEGGVDYAANAPPVAGAEGRHTIGRFGFEAGGVLNDLKIGYVTHGNLNAARDNAILLLPGTANTQHSADGYIGPGKAFDTDRYFVIAVDAIGAGTSSKPSDGLGGRFPAYNIRDMVGAEHALVRQAFGISRLRAVAGASMGAFQALEWAILHPQMVAAAMLIVPAPRAGQVFRSVVSAAAQVVQLDPAWTGGRYSTPPVAGLRAAGRLYYPWTVTDAWIEQLTPERLEAETAGTAERAAQWDAWDFLRRYEASASHDVSAPFGGDMGRALACVQAPTLVLPSSSDRLLPVAAASAMAQEIRHATYAEIPSARGHLAWRAVEASPETRFVTHQIARFLGTQG